MPEKIQFILAKPATQIFQKKKKINSFKSSSVPAFEVSGTVFFKFFNSSKIYIWKM